MSSKDTSSDRERAGETMRAERNQEFNVECIYEYAIYISVSLLNIKNTLITNETYLQ